MDKKKLQIMFCMLLVFGVIISRLYLLTGSEELQRRAKNQNQISFVIEKYRGNIYDRNYKQLVNTEIKYKGLLSNEFKEIQDLEPYLVNKEKFFSRYKEEQYNLVDVIHGGFALENMEIIPYQTRYSDKQLASHIIGYVDKQENKGLAGLEKNYNSFLTEGLKPHQVSFTRTAKNDLLLGSKRLEMENSAQGVLTTLDKDLLEIIQEVGEKYIDKGSILITDGKSNEILAGESFPALDPNDVAKSIENPKGPFLNRNYTNYPIGSTFKLFIAGVALDNGISKETTVFCTGEIDVNGQIYKCHKLDGHGKQNLQRAIINSCNPYFVDLIFSLSPEMLNNTAKQLGLDKGIPLGKDIITNAGTIPSIDNLKNAGEKANFSFGQGMLTGTPVHVANLIHSILNGGKYLPSNLVQGEIYSRTTKIDTTGDAIGIFKEETANFLKQCMLQVIEEGTGTLAKPNTERKAGGKTATAQTGQYDEMGNEYLTGWFSGFYPETEPKYIIIILLEHGGEGGLLAAPIFKEIVERIDKLS